MWFKVDDKLPSNRKTRKVLRSHPEKRRDSAALGLWVLCGAWAGQNEAEAGWVPEAELDRFDDGWEQLAARLVDADFWWPEVLNGEPGFAFVNWAEYKPSQGASDDGRRGNHTRWHVARGVVSESCEFCPKDPGTLPDPPPENTDHRGDDRPDIAPESGTESGSIANPTRPDPTRPDPTRPDPGGAGGETPNTRALATIEPKTPAKADDTKRGTRIIDGFMPARTPGNLKAEAGWSDDELRRHLAQFRDYWTAAAGRTATKRDWEAAWRFWLGNEQKRKPQRRQTTMGGIDWEAAAARAAALDAAGGV